MVEIRLDLCVESELLKLNFRLGTKQLEELSHTI